MARLTITLSDERHRALKEAAARRNRTIGQLIEESLERNGIKTRETALEIMAIARANAAKTGASDEEIAALAVSGTRRVRRRQHRM